MPLKPKIIWHSPEEIVEIGFQQSRVVMMNEAHSDWKRCIRTRQIGNRILPTAHQAGVRHFAMEALFPFFAEQANRTRRLPEGDWGYLSQPEMKDLVQTGLDLGWTLLPYEADAFQWLRIKHGINFSDADDPNEMYQRLQEFRAELMTDEYTNWREEQQALNLISALQALQVGAPLLVWCGNNHHSKRASHGWKPMGYQFQRHSRIVPFVIDQTWSVLFDGRDNKLSTKLVMQVSDELMTYDGTAGFLRKDVPVSLWRYPFQGMGNDAYLLSTQNELE